MKLFTLLASTLIFSLSTSFAADNSTNNQQPTTTKPLAVVVTDSANLPHAGKTSPLDVIPSAPTLDAKGYLLMDANSGQIIAQKNMHQRMQPASLTKLMTLYLTFQALKTGQINLDDLVTISVKAWKTGGSRMFIRANTKVPLSQLIQGVIVDSGNDACVALAEYVAGNEKTFAQMMNMTAQQLGMADTHYVDSTGLPRADHYSTPYDMSLLTRAIIQDFPDYYHFFKEKSLTYDKIHQNNRNRLLWRDDSVDGLKTGHTKEAGYCLISSAKRQGMRLISIVMGAPTDNGRINDSQMLLNYGFRFYKTYQLYGAEQSVLQRRVWMADNKFAQFGLENPLYVTIPVRWYKYLKPVAEFDKTQLQAPIKKGQRYGQLLVVLNGKTIKKVNLVALQNDAKGGIFTWLFDHTVLLFKKL